MASSWVLLIVCTTFSLASARELLQTVSNTSLPWFCRDGPCAPFQLLSTNDDYYEIRQYDEGLFASGTGTGSNYTEAFGEAFRLGYRYELGFNAANQTIAAAGYLIATTTILPDNSSTVTANLPLFPENLNNTIAPTPLNQNVSLVTDFGGIYAVSSYGGYANGAIIQSVSAQLASSLTAAGIAFNDTIYSVVYDQPFRVDNRHNEVWYKLTDYDGATSPTPSSTG